ncbi:hypothetical protein DFP72DRAFT_930088 [Ephemerocybe angulata]|uniref:Uncharacterized protein n=1 Tax=Ephemerocybe angulata TaxID=980116 RepID=A0A8H6LXD4_9AGAR|nr:hypothetical protein DFP72DRAFT_930088 [Tulosesus angulatus]
MHGCPRSGAAISSVIYGFAYLWLRGSVAEGSDMDDGTWGGQDRRQTPDRPKDQWAWTLPCPASTVSPRRTTVGGW